MLRVVVESAKGLPKKKLGNPDPVTSVIFKGKSPFKSLLKFLLSLVSEEITCSLIFGLKYVKKVFGTKSKFLLYFI